MLKLPDELKELVSGEQVYRKRTHRQKMQEDDKTKI